MSENLVFLLLRFISILWTFSEKGKLTEFEITKALKLLLVEKPLSEDSTHKLLTGVKDICKTDKCD